jgi:hypothetical protein
MPPYDSNCTALVMSATVVDLRDVSINRCSEGSARMGQRPGVVLETHFRPLAGHHRVRGDGVVQFPIGGSSSDAGAAAGWPASIWPAVCCTVAAGAGAISWWAAKSAAWSAIPLSL